MRIAWVCPYLPAPENSGGRIRIANMARAFGDDELHLYLRLASDDPDAKACVGLSPWRSIHGRRAKFPRIPELVVPAVPLSFPPQVKRLLAEHDRVEPFDAVILEHCYSAHALPDFRRAALILCEHNVESEYWLREMRSRPKGALKNGVTYLRWRRFESAVWQKADAIAVVSEIDRMRVQEVRPDTGVVIPNGISIENYSFIPPSRRRGRSILFVGLLSYLPNIEAAQTLAEGVLPLVRRHFPDATLTLAGRDPHKRVRALASSSVHVTGTVPNIAALFDQHAAFANPIAFGAGSSLKALEPLAAGLPMVGSPFAVRGYGLQPGTHYVQANTPDQLADALCRVLAEPASLDGMARNARQVAERYAWSGIREEFAALVRRTVDSKRQVAA
jgi:polysaccharide biosynthesis protein PslH